MSANSMTHMGRDGPSRYPVRFNHSTKFFVTLGKISSTHRQDAQAIVRRAKATLEFLDAKRTMAIFRDYLDGVAPPVPILDLEMERVPGVRVNGILDRFDESNNIESWVFTMRGDKVGALYERAGIRLFARNVRGFLGATMKVNEGMLETLDDEPVGSSTTTTE